MNYNIITTLIVIIPILMFCIYYCFAGIKEENIWDSPSTDKGCICAIISFINVVCFIGFEINNSIFTTILIIIEAPILIWTVFTKCFNKFENKKMLYSELLYIYNQENLTDFKKHMTRKEQIEFLKSIKVECLDRTREENINSNGEKVVATKDIYQYIPLIENEEDLKYWEDILRKE
jgi:hypothetical protein